MTGLLARFQPGSGWKIQMLRCEPGCNDDRAGVCGPETQKLQKAWEESQPSSPP